MPVELTHLSAVEYENIISGNMTPAMAADYLRNGRIVMRSFADTLREMYPAVDLSVRLTDFFLSVTPEANPQSISKKIRNWLSGRNNPSDREDVFRIAFALNLGEQQLNYLLSLCTGFGIQYRNNREIVFVWFLRSGYAYENAGRFFDSLPPVEERNAARTKRTSRLTHEVRAEFQIAGTVEELRNCYVRNLDNFGTMHLRAYYYFEKYLNQLIHPTPQWDYEETEPDYSLEAVMDTYLSLQIPSGRKRTDYTVVQKLLKQNWPNATSIKNIRNHKEDVPRKLLLLLYVVTENETAGSDSYNELDEDYMPLEDKVEYHWWTLNAILEDSGMAPLDPRNATDWLILYAISSSPEEPMSDRLEQVISCVFGSAGGD
ncbi:MAG: hypothetical protein NC331_04020 [Lachnospiraceae bacterium]|nr:hypothetical protein [Lachnospiraceae bacterium]MCM1215597.1 hypothetical protein [Lachnospiraceae bacterium]MCM1238532.1 hypothetical protein [Lachnospiraceae bacterium]